MNAHTHDAIAEAALMRPAPELHEMFPPSRPDDTDSIQDAAAAIVIMFALIVFAAYLFGFFGS